MNNAKKLKVACVADHFMTEEFYRATFKDLERFELTGISYFGAHTREEMRAMVDRIEKVGAESYAPPRELYAHVKDADVLVVHLCPVPRALMEAAPNLKYILSNRGGLENIDVDAAKELGIHVINNPAHNSNAVAELTVCLMICETRNVARANKGLKDGIWREDYPNYGRVFELRGQTVGLIGFGNIGRLVAEKLMPFGTKVIAADPAVTPDDPDLARYGVELVDLDTLLKRADVVSLHARSLKMELILDEREFALMKPTAIFINCARGPIVDNAALADALNGGETAGAGIDVFDMEPPIPQDYPLLHAKNTLLMPHTAFLTAESMLRRAEIEFANVEAYLAGSPANVCEL
jgi:D-3-phosphoglycerate dehydrogenase